MSIVLTGRNDDHGLDFRQRLFRTLRFNHQELVARRIPHEYVFVEWAPSPDRPLLVDLISREFSDSRDLPLRSFIVDRRYQEAMSLNPRLEYLEFVAKNVGVRRARGSYVLSTNCDVYFGRRVFELLERGDLEARTVYRAARHDLKLGSEHSHLSWEVLEDPRNLDGPPRGLRLPLLTGGTGDFILLDRETFFEMGGFNEIYRLARMGIDHNFLVKTYSCGVEVEDVGGPIYHINHVGSYRLSKDSYDDRQAEASWGDRRWRYQGVVYTNPPGWGLGDAPVRDAGADRWYLDFTWKAVPPLVDLRRIVLPVDRVGRPQPRRYVPKK